MGLSQAQKDALSTLLADDDGDQEEETEETDDGDQEEETEETDDNEGGDVLVLRGPAADSFLSRWLGVEPEPAAAAPPAKKAAAKKAAPPAKKAAAKKAAPAAPPPQDPPPPKAKFF